MTRTLIVGGGTVGQMLATRLEDRGDSVWIVEENRTLATTLESNGRTVHHGDGTDPDVLRSAGIEQADILVVATGNDDTNLLIAQLASARYSVDRTIVRVNRPNNVEPFEDLGIEVISSTEATAHAIDNLIERPSITEWTSAVGHVGDVQEVEITADEYAGNTIADLDEIVPNGCIVALIKRDGDIQLPDRDETLAHGDYVTLIGQRDAVHTAICRLHPSENIPPQTPADDR